MKRIWLFLLLGVALLAGGCAKQVARCTAPEDNPAHHYLRGMEALESGKIDLAQEKFDRALYCEENFSAAYGGKAIVAALKAKGMGDAGYRAIEVARAEEYLEKAKKLTETDNDRFEYQLAVLRVSPAVKGKDWLDRLKRPIVLFSPLRRLMSGVLTTIRVKRPLPTSWGWPILRGISSARLRINSARPWTAVRWASGMSRQIRPGKRHPKLCGPWVVLRLAMWGKRSP